MKMHAEKKHKCFKCSNGYSTEWDLKRHIENCGKTYQCTCGCPYASRAALLSHIYRTGHEIPTEHRYVPEHEGFHIYFRTGKFWILMVGNLISAQVPSS